MRWLLSLLWTRGQLTPDWLLNHADDHDLATLYEFQQEEEARDA